MGKKIIRTLLIYVFVLAVLVAIIFLPRVRIPAQTTQIVNEDGYMITVPAMDTTYTYYRFDLHWNEIKMFFMNWFETGTMGITRYNVTVETELWNSAKNSLLVIFSALIISFFAGIAKGFFDFRMQRKKLSFFGHGTTWIFQSIPDFVIILFVQLLIIRYLPITDFFNREGWDAFILPSILVSIFPTMYIARITSAGLLGQSGELYIQVARAKGLSERKILYKHIFRNCIGTILTHLSSLMVYVLTCLLFVEYFMNYPGAMYRLFLSLGYSPYVQAGTLRYEGPMIFAICLLFMCLILLVQLISFVARRYFEPQMGDS